MKAHLDFCLGKYVGLLKNLNLLCREDICMYVACMLPVASNFPNLAHMPRFVHLLVTFSHCVLYALVMFAVTF